jgi:hypothetical protein
VAIKMNEIGRVCSQNKAEKCIFKAYNRKMHQNDADANRLYFSTH